MNKSVRHEHQDFPEECLDAHHESSIMVGMKNKHSDLVKTQVYLTRKQNEALRRLAESKGLSVAEMLRRVLDAGLRSQRDSDAQNQA